MKIISSLCVLLSSSHVIANPSHGLIGGAPVNTSEYPEVIRITTGRSYCSASLIGPRVIITAGHCTRQNGEIRPVSETDVYQFSVRRKVFKARCTLAPGYVERQGEGSQDLALCKIDKAVEVKYAKVAKEDPKRGDRVTLIGYGCVRSDLPRGGNDGVLRVGESTVTRESSDRSFHYQTEGGAAVCYGDSGGPAFKLVEDPKDERHIIQGINSMGNIDDLSMLTSVARSLDFLRDFEAEQDVEICGLSLDCDEEDQKR